MLIGLLTTLNEEEFLEDFFEHTLPLIDLLVVTEGAVIGNPFSTSNGHSIDKTSHIIMEYKERYPDKIKVIANNTKWLSKQEMQNSMLSFVKDGDWIWIFGTDEFYLPDTRKKLDSLIEKYPNITEFIPSFIHFWDKDHIIVDKQNIDYRLLQRHQRIFLVQNYMFYVNHPTINDCSNRDLFFHEHYRNKRMILDIETNQEIPIHFKKLTGHYNTNSDEAIQVFHYGFTRQFESQIKKSIYYMMRDKNMKPTDAFNYVKDKIKEIGNIHGYINQIHSSVDTDIIEFNKDHPLKNKVWNDSENIDFNNILKYLENFNEKPEK